MDLDLDSWGWKNSIKHGTESQRNLDQMGHEIRLVSNWQSTMSQCYPVPNGKLTSW